MLKIVKKETFPLQSLDKRMMVVVILWGPKFRNHGKEERQFTTAIGRTI